MTQQWNFLVGLFWIGNTLVTVYTYASRQGSGSDSWSFSWAFSLCRHGGRLPAFSCGRACLVANEDFLASLDLSLQLLLLQEVAVLALLPELPELVHRLLRQEVPVLVLVPELPQLVDRLLRQHLELVLPPRPRMAADCQRTRGAGGRHRAFLRRYPWWSLENRKKIC